MFLAPIYVWQFSFEVLNHQTLYRRTWLTILKKKKKKKEEEEEERCMFGRFVGPFFRTHAHLRFTVGLIIALC
jgi:hypothetical protein